MSTTARAAARCVRADRFCRAVRPSLSTPQQLNSLNFYNSLQPCRRATPTLWNASLSAVTSSSTRPALSFSVPRLRRLHCDNGLHPRDAACTTLASAAIKRGAMNGDIPFCTLTTHSAYHAR